MIAESLVVGQILAPDQVLHCLRLLQLQLEHDSRCRREHRLHFVGHLDNVNINIRYMDMDMVNN